MGRTIANVLVILTSITAADAQSKRTGMNSLIGKSPNYGAVTFVDIRTTQRNYEGFGLVELYCVKDGPSMALGKINGILYAINGTARGMYKNGGMYAVYAGGVTENVNDVQDLKNYIDLTGKTNVVQDARTPCM